MTSLTEKYAGFVDLLTKKTKENKIPWSFDKEKNTCSVWNAQTYLVLSIGSDENFEPLYAISLYNSNGDYLEGFNDMFFGTLQLMPGEKNYYIRMSELFEMAKRQSTGADAALDAFIKAVEDDDLIPF